MRIACTHGLFADGALQRLGAEPDVLEIVCTNTVPVPMAKRTDKLRCCRWRRRWPRPMRRIHNGESVSALFS